MSAGQSAAVANEPVRVLIVTCAHRGDDARIVHRQAASLLAAGHHVTLVAPPPPEGAADPAGLLRVAIPRAVGRRRIASWCAARSVVRSRRAEVDLLLLHDPELVPVLARPRWPTPIVWDVHEDFVASVSDRPWIPRWMRPAVRCAVGGVEWIGRRWCRVILAEDSYASRFPGAPVVPNSTWVPAQPPPFEVTGRPRLLYVGRISVSRGAHELIELGRRLHERVDLVVIGEPDAAVRPALQHAARDGVVRWLGYLPNPDALANVRGALAGLSLLHDHPNYVRSRPTKVIEYLAQGVPVITTPLPVAAEMVEASGGGVVVRQGDVDAVVEVVDRWLSDRDERARAAAAGHAFVKEHFSWQVDGRRFVELVERWAAERRSG